MSELLDLPPELIEHIFLFDESVQESLRRIREASGNEKGAKRVVPAPLFRLANRYIEQCTRRIFAKSFFGRQRVLMIYDVCIRRFCDQARFPDLVKYVDGLHFFVANDQHGRIEIPPATRYELVDALRACPPTCALVFRDVPRENPYHLHREDRKTGELEAPACHNVIDMSSSFSFVLSVAEEAGMRPKSVTTWSCKEEEMSLLGLADCFAIAERNSVLSEVERLDVEIVPPQPEQGVTPENMQVKSTCMEDENDAC
jgi:hypothetical protein